MKQKLLFTFLLLAAGAILLQAQDYPVSVADGPSLTVKADSLTLPPPTLPLPGGAPDLIIQLPSTLIPPLFETKEQKAAKINDRVESDVMRSVGQNLRWYQPPKLTRTAYALLRVGGLFLSDPNRFPDGCIPMMNPSNPFVYFKTPGMAPYEHIYAPEFFPQCIRTEYDFASGTYRQVMLPWQQVNANMSRSLGGPYRNEPVPKMYFSSAERALHQ